MNSLRKNAVWEHFVMIAAISGAGVLVAACVALWYIKPHNGNVHWHANVMILDSALPVLVLCAFALGVAMIISGVAEMG